MVNNQLIEKIALEAIAELKNYFLIKLTISASNHILILYDADGEGIKINELARLNRNIRERIDLEKYYPEGNYSLEVSSYGLDHPLLQHRQYVKNIGRHLRIIMQDGTEKTGELKKVNNDCIEIEIILKKKPSINEQILFTNIKETFIEIKF